jgi:hypothetical protein
MKSVWRMQYVPVASAGPLTFHGRRAAVSASPYSPVATANPARRPGSPNSLVSDRATTTPGVPASDGRSVNPRNASSTSNGVSASRHRAANPSSAAGSSASPVGLFGLQTIARACSARSSGPTSSTVSWGTNAGSPPWRRTSRAYSPKLGNGTSTESPGETARLTTERMAARPPGIGTTSSGRQSTYAAAALR